MSWVYLIIAILFEVAGTTSMKFSAGLTRFWPSVFIFVFYAISFSLLALALKKLDISMTYAVWSGLGTLTITLIGFVWFKEVISLQKIISILFIIIGVIGLNLSQKAN